MKSIREVYNSWLENATELRAELENMQECEIEDAFYRNLAFGTGGLRGLIGAGTNRMNIYTVAKASLGLANYITKNFDQSKWKIAISRDSRINSDIFAKVSAEVFAANGIRVYIYKEIMPTPCLSYAVRELDCVAGVMITASHNPAVYNGYKVYDSKGCQITEKAAVEIYSEIEALNIFSDVSRADFDSCLESGRIEWISSAVYDSFIKSVLAESVLFGDAADRNVSIVYTPLNGTGLKPVTRVLTEAGFTNIMLVPKQEQPDGNFPTCPYPNPEIREAMELGIALAKEQNAELLIATDPDCDRVGIAVKSDNEYTLLTGNQVGLLLLDFICSQRKKHNRMPKDPVMVKTVVTCDLAEKIAESYNVSTINVLTGFKFIGEQIGILEEFDKENSYLLGFEESYGYLSGSYVRDKDGVNGVLMISEMFAYYKKQQISLLERLRQLYERFGYCLDTLHSYAFEGASGFNKMNSIMDGLRGELKSLGGESVCEVVDYAKGVDGLPKADVVKFVMKCGSVVVRPSGTEPKLKIYVSVTANDEAMAKDKEVRIIKDLEERLK